MAKKGKLNVTSKEINFEWIIPNLFSHQNNTDGSYDSPVFYFANTSWCLNIYPKGSTKYESQDYVGLYISRKSTGPPITLKCSLAIKAVKGKKDFERQFKHVFTNNKRGQGYSRFISRAKLSERDELMPLNVLTIIAFCTVEESKKKDETETLNINPCSPSPESAEALEKIKPKRKPRISDAEVSASKSSTIPHDHKVLADLKELFFRKEDCDVVIRVKGQEFPAHKIILKARSRVFASTFRSNMKEKATGVVDIEDCDPSAFSDFLCFLYCGDVDVISQENVFSLFTAADKYDVQDLRAKCIEFIKKNITVNTFCDTIALALLHSETELIKSATEFFTKNAPEIILTVKWQLFLAENPTQSNELLVKLLAPNKNLYK